MLKEILKNMMENKLETFVEFMFVVTMFVAGWVFLVVTH
tara:strand:- start:293 stop:409 length:117 start_codon:yes stop_codon:yes gene_type:complete